MALFPQTAGGGEWRNKEMDYFYFYLPLLGVGEMQRRRKVVGEWYQQLTFFLLYV